MDKKQPAKKRKDPVCGRIHKEAGKEKYAFDRRGKLEQVADKARIRFVKAYGQE